jgi:hypothetical protein
MSILEMIILNETVSVYCNKSDRCILAQTGTPVKMVGNVYEQLRKVDIQPSSQIVASMLAKLVDHVDTLLEDWYPDLGARFIQNARGMYLITRIVPCTRCLLRQIEIQSQELSSAESWSMIDINPTNEKSDAKTESHVTNKSTNQSPGSKNLNSARQGGSGMFLDGVGGTAVVHQEILSPTDGPKTAKQQPASARLIIHINFI